MNFSVNAYDPDGAISNIEWFLTGYDLGRATPSFSGTATNVSYAFPAAGVYTSRVEVVDNYKARTWRESVITVTASTACTVSASAGIGGTITPSGDIVLPFGSTRAFTNTSSSWYHLGPVVVDGANVGTPSVYIFTNTLVDHVIAANFTADLAPNTTPYWWLTQYPSLTNGGISLAAAETNDADGDRMTALQEYIAGTDPTNPASSFLLTVTMSNGHPVVTFPANSPGIQYGVTNRYYALESTTNILTGSWAIVPGCSNVSAASGPVITYSVLAGATNSFFRCKACLGP